MDNLFDATPDVVLIGAGIMSATLGTILKELDPSLRIQMFERLESASQESSDAWNNAGTGHSALCELNYTPEKSDGSIDASKAVDIMEQFEVSRQFWSYLVDKGELDNPKSFIRTTPHMSFVWDQDNVEYLRKRFEALQQYQLFKGMEFSTDHQKMEEWMPLVMEGRSPRQAVAATHTNLGTDVNFGALTRSLIASLEKKDGFGVAYNFETENIKRTEDGRWKLSVRNLETGIKHFVFAKFVFIGAGGGSLHLLQKTGIPESKGFGGFPVGGQWLVCTNPDIIKRHHAKVYGKASVGAPPMSVPHLDTRIIDGQEALLFGPYAGFSTKFLKRGSYCDLFRTIKWSNIIPMLKVGLTNFGLLKYLIQQVTLSFSKRVHSLQDFMPNAIDEDWKVEIAGQRVQVIKNDPQKGGILQFGTEVVTAADGSVSALLGASPGASTSVSIMLKLLKQCFPEKFKGGWDAKLKQMIPSYGTKLENDNALCNKLRRWTSASLQLDWQQPE
ncbi:MAG: malate:quinone oxidoreductase [Chitinophagaceae bacterium]